MALITDPDEVQGTMARKAKSRRIKYAFYFRTRDQFESVIELVDRMNREIGSTRSGLFQTMPAEISSPPWHISEIRNKIPKSKPGRKKYIATIKVNPLEHTRISFNVAEAVEELGLEMVSNAPNKPKYSNDDFTFGSVVMRSPEHFKKVTSMLNKQYGHGNWHYRGVRKILPKLKQIENYRDGTLGMFSKAHKEMQEMASKGLRVDVAVEGKVDNLGPLLFKAQLMG